MSNEIKILYVEDELALAHIVRDTLRRQGYHVHLVSDGAEVMDNATKYTPDICILDVMLPNVDGFSLGRQINQKFPKIPILYLTAKDEVSDVIKGFKSGGRDYLKKPFSIEELIIRIENLLSLAPKQAVAEVLQIGQYQFVPKKLLLQIQGTERKLTYRETELLLAFFKQQNEIINKRQLLLDIWGDDTLSNARNLDVYIAKLRDYLSDDEQVNIITLRGVGYRFNVE